MFSNNYLITKRTKILVVASLLPVLPFLLKLVLTTAGMGVAVLRMGMQAVYVMLPVMSYSFVNLKVNYPGVDMLIGRMYDLSRISSAGNIDVIYWIFQYGYFGSRVLLLVAVVGVISGKQIFFKTFVAALLLLMGFACLDLLGLVLLGFNGLPRIIPLIGDVVPLGIFSWILYRLNLDAVHV